MVICLRRPHWGLVGAWSAPSHHPNQCCNKIKSKLRNKFQWNLKQNPYIFIQENAFNNVVCEMATILSRPQCVKCMDGSSRSKVMIFLAIYVWNDGYSKDKDQSVSLSWEFLCLDGLYIEAGPKWGWLNCLKYEVCCSLLLMTKNMKSSVKLSLH